MYTSPGVYGFFPLDPGSDGQAGRRLQPGQKKKRLTDIFITSSRYEYLFWEMAEKLEQWSA